MVIAVLGTGAILTSCGGSSTASHGIKGASEVAAQPVKTSGANPFMPSVGKDVPGITPPSGATSSGGGLATYSAALPGLYGGTRNQRSCDANKLVAFLARNPSKAAAWASTLGIRASQISHYVSGLTPVLLRTDTRVTNHGYVNGVADPLQSVLEAGTAVFVDKYGQPVVKCYCGNPLTAPVLYSSPTYTGPIWAGFSTTTITIIQVSTTIINKFTLYDPTTNKFFGLTRGKFGRAGPYLRNPGSATTSTGTTSTPTVTTAPSPAPTPGTSSTQTTSAPTENPSASFSPNPVTIGDTVTLNASGFLPGAPIRIDVTRPDGGQDSPRTTTAGSDGSVTYSFPNAGAGEMAGTYTVTVTDANTGVNTTTQVTTVSAGGTGSGTT